MKEYISVLCPTRRRPKNVDRFVASAMETADYPDGIEFVFYVDDDDDETLTAEVFQTPNPNIRVVRGPRITHSDLWNRCCEVARGPYLQQTGDDLIYRTPGWDTAFRKAFEQWDDRIGLVFADDGGPSGTRFATNGVLHRNWVRVVGYFSPKYFSSDYSDTWINDVAEKIKRKKLVPGILAEHMHPVWGKAEWDVTHNERVARHNRDNVGELYNSLGHERDEDARKLVEFIANPTTEVVWSILISTIPQRQAQLQELFAVLQPQVDAFGGEIEVVVFPDDQQWTVGEKRQALVEAAKGRYVSFVDDDDLVADNFCELIMEALADNPDFVGFRLQQTLDGRKLKPTFHSLKYSDWSEDTRGYYRNISHLNPMLRNVALKARFDGGYGEDRRWVEEIAATELLKVETYVDEVMYFYRSLSDKSLWSNKTRLPLVPPEMPSSNFRRI